MQLVSPQPEQADFYTETIDLLCEQLCDDCPLRNRLGVVTMERAFANEDMPEVDRVDLAISEADMISRLAAAAAMRRRAGCEGKQTINCCENCGNDVECGALEMVHDYMDKRSDKDDE
ncbi:MAG: hypothetical protein JWM37_836 [Candidatus Saccharibacteria bacterium]|nr:hypothetical protein [Candidatus Saccharibacteria bacterium]